jgi:hypothetical protein
MVYGPHPSSLRGKTLHLNLSCPQAPLRLHNMLLLEQAFALMGELKSFPISLIAVAAHSHRSNVNWRCTVTYCHHLKRAQHGKNSC